MPTLRLLAPTLLAPAGFFLLSALASPANAQSTATTLALTATATTQPFLLNWPKPDDFKLNLTDKSLADKSAANKALKDALKSLQSQKTKSPLAQTTQPCAKLRVYGFTPKDLKSPHPHPSTETDCTPTSTAHLRPLDLPATVNPK